MICIKRKQDGTHEANGFCLSVDDFAFYRKKTLTRATCMAQAFSVETLEGTMTGMAGDWLMVGVEGEMYPCDKGIFEQIYELVPDPEA